MHQNFRLVDQNYTTSSSSSHLFRMMCSYPVLVYCDLHGHSRKQQMFVYGCRSADPSARLNDRVFPLMLSRNAPELVSIDRWLVNLWIFSCLHAYIIELADITWWCSYVQLTRNFQDLKCHFVNDFLLNIRKKWTKDHSENTELGALLFKSQVILMIC